MPVVSAPAADESPSASDAVTVVDLRGASAGGAPAFHVLEDPSGRRARYLAVAARVTGGAFLVWLALLLLGGVGLIPAGSVPLGKALLPEPVSREAAPVRSLEPDAPADRVATRRSQAPAAPGRGTRISERPTDDRPAVVRRRSSTSTPAAAPDAPPAADPAPAKAPTPVATTPATSAPTPPPAPATTKPTGSSGTSPGSGQTTGASGISPGSGKPTGNAGTAPGSGNPTGADGTAPGSGRPTGGPADKPR
jgi:hypothetical protein